MAEDIRESFIRLFGEDKAPSVPTNKQELLALPMTQLATVEARLPEFYESLAAAPEGLPAAVSLRYSKRQLQPSDAPVLRAHGMPFTAQKLERGAADAAVADLTQKLEAARAAHEQTEARRKAEMERVRTLSRKGFVGRV